MAEDFLDVIEVGLTIKLIDSGACEPELAKRIVSEFIAESRDAYGGQPWMVKRGYRKFSPALLDEMRAKYQAGASISTLCDAYGMGRTTFYERVLKKSG